MGLGNQGGLDNTAAQIAAARAEGLADEAAISGGPVSTISDDPAVLTLDKYPNLSVFSVVGIGTSGTPYDLSLMSGLTVSVFSAVNCYLQNVVLPTLNIFQLFGGVEPFVPPVILNGSTFVPRAGHPTDPTDWMNALLINFYQQWYNAGTNYGTVDLGGSKLPYPTGSANDLGSGYTALCSIVGGPNPITVTLPGVPLIGRTGQGAGNIYTDINFGFGVSALYYTGIPMAISLTTGTNVSTFDVAALEYAAAQSNAGAGPNYQDYVMVDPNPLNGIYVGADYATPAAVTAAAAWTPTTWGTGAPTAPSQVIVGRMTAAN